jgi:hypothetical protein
VLTPDEAFDPSAARQQGNNGRRRHMFTKVFTRTLWTVLVAAVMTGYATAVVRLAGVEI